MKNKIQTSSLILFLCLSVFCFCYLNFGAANTTPITPELPTISESVIETEPETSEILLPDLRFVERSTEFLGRLFRAL